MAAALVGLFVLVSEPSSARARTQGSKLSRLPEVVETKNSQTMNLLEGHLNSNPTPSVGKQLAVVDDSALLPDTSSVTLLDASVSGQGQISTYVVREGDTLDIIAKMFNVSKNTIVWANDLKKTTIAAGQMLVILPVSGVRHTVAKGDTIATIAKKYGADQDDILAYNDLSADAALSVGEIVIVPDGEITQAAVPTPVKTGATITSTAGYYIRPAAGPKTQGIHGHNGIDIGAPIGTSVVASASGSVIVAKLGGYNGGYGNYIVISHGNGTQTLYAHLTSISVSVGQTVGQGEYIGATGNSGKSTGPHLHFEVRGAKNPF